MPRLLLIVLIASFLGIPAWTEAQIFVYLNSQPGDWIGQGQQQTLTTADGTFSVLADAGGVDISFEGFDPGIFWDLSFGPPTGKTFTRGEYEGAQRFAFHAPPKPGIDVYGDGRGCGTDAGRFLVSDLAFAQDGSLERFAVDFEQHCEGAPPALYGSVRYNSSVTVVPRFSIGDAVALKGNVGTHAANVLLSLSMPSDKLVSVHYDTADGTAIQGVDYVRSSGTVQFQPNTTVQSVPIPIIGDRLARGNKSFQARLSSPQGAPMGDSLSNLIILDPNIPMTALALSSQPGDYIGQGQLYLFTIADGVFTSTRNFDNGVSVTLHTSDFWDTDFAAPDSAPLTPGIYNNAQRFPFQSLGVPGLNVDGAGRGCDILTGRFGVLRAIYRPDGTVQNFAVDFEQHCEGAAPALFGSIRINAELRQISVSDAVINGLSAAFTVTLNPSATKRVTVNFATADGTAIAGSDYVATSKTVSFAPGESQKLVTVPLLKQPDGGKIFFGQLSAPNGSLIWIAQGSATF